MKVKILILLFFLFTINIQSQTVNLKEIDYTKADSIAINFPKKRYKSSSELAKMLTTDLNTDYEKFRVLFRWITENIKYRKGNYGKDADRTLKKGKAVCEGYANLLTSMCNEVGIITEVIIGYSKIRPSKYSCKRRKETDHAWNAVKLQDKWYLVDVTWASGGYDVRKNKFYKEYDDYYFLTPPNEFMYSHYPKDKRWFLTNKIISKKEFKKLPVFYPDFFNLDIQLLSNNKCFIKNKLEISIKTKKEFSDMYVYFDNQQEFRKISFSKNDDIYNISLKFNKGDKGGFYLYFDNYRIIGLNKR